jgi:hypothetical protein
VVEGIIAYRIGQYLEYKDEKPISKLSIFQHTLSKAILSDDCAVKPLLRKRTIARLQKIVDLKPIDDDWSRDENLRIYSEMGGE